MSVDTSRPIFADIFADCWSELPPAMHKHYLNHPYSSDHTQVNGTINVWCARPLKIFSKLLWMLKSIPPHCEEAVPITVDFHSSPDNRQFYFRRHFQFRKTPDYVFISSMEQVSGNLVIERMPYKIGWQMRYIWENHKVTLIHHSYVLCLASKKIPLPIGWLIGKGYAEEWATDDDHFSMKMFIKHPWRGKLYQYDGDFRITKLPDHISTDGAKHL